MRILADDVSPWLREGFSGLGEVIPVPGDSIDAPLLDGVDVLLTRSVTRVDRALIDGSSLQFIGSATAGIDHSWPPGGGSKVSPPNGSGSGSSSSPSRSSDWRSTVIVTGTVMR